MREYITPTTFYLGLFHIVPLAAFFLPLTLLDWIVCGILYLTRIFFIGAGYHRYFSHRSFKTSRIAQFFLAFFAQTSAQGGVLWWAAEHRKHHRFTDKDEDLHSPKEGFFHSHIGWLLKSRDRSTDYKYVRDFARYPELVFLNKFHMLPPFLLALSCFLLGGWSMLVIGFFLSTLLVFHVTWTINSFSHIIGFQRYETGDTSKNNWFLALITLGEGWHNNHHFYPNSTRQGFKWWEYDITFYVLKILSWIRIIRDLIPVPEIAKQKF